MENRRITLIKRERAVEPVYEFKHIQASEGPGIFFTLLTGIMAIAYLVMSITHTTPEGYLDSKNFALAMIFLALSALSGGAGHYLSNNKKLGVPTIGFLIAGGLSIILAAGYWITGV